MRYFFFCGFAAAKALKRVLNDMREDEGDGGDEGEERTFILLEIDGNFYASLS